VFVRNKGSKFLGSIIYLSPLIILGVLSLTKNLLFINAGMMEPDFTVIFKCYTYNFTIQPLILFCLGVLYVLLFLFAKKVKLFLSLALFSLLSAFALWSLKYYVTAVEPKKCLIKYEIITTNKITKPIKIIHFSDIQSASIGDYEAYVFEKIADLSPDLILYTGDFLQLDASLDFDDQWNKLQFLFKGLKPRLGIYAVFGDTEFELYSKTDHELEPITMLSSKSDTFEYEGGKISLLGLSLYQSKKPLWAMRSIEIWEDSEPDEHLFRIIMGHAPDFALALKDSNIDLCLAGHTHGGQVRLPLIGPLIIDSKVPTNWAHGCHQIGIPFLNVSAGVGSNRFNGLPPIRFNCPTEFTLIELIPE
tara:strand:+ start:506 stop:1591 length:1086 start_codon:yes stop_codon:yes gene_type:complete